MSFTRKQIIVGLLGVVIVIGVGVGIYFAVAGRSSSNPGTTPSTDSSTDKLLVKSNDGAIRLYDRSVQNYTETKVDEQLLKIISFGPYLNQTIYYATTEPNSVIRSSGKKETYPDLPSFTAEWIKTAIAVDELTKKVYVVDREAEKIYVVEGQNMYLLPLTLIQPKDVILVPEIGKLYVLEERKIIMADMDGTNLDEILTSKYILQAFTIDNANKFLYFAHEKGIESYELATKKRVVISEARKSVRSLAYVDSRLYFIEKEGESSDKLNTILNTCQLDDAKCSGKCCSVFAVQNDTKLEQVKIYKTEIPQVKHACETKNGGCEQLCLLNSSKDGRSCRCGKGFVLKDDNKTCEKEIVDKSTDKLLIKFNDGAIRLYDRSVQNYTETKVDEQLLKIISFGPYLNQTIYYATTEPNSVIRSSGKKETYPDLPSFTAEWIKTAIAVDELTKKVYVVDREAEKIYVVEGQNMYLLPLTLIQPKDVILVPEIGKLYVLEEWKIIMADMDGTNSVEILASKYILQAFTIDNANKFLYFAHEKGIESYELATEKRVVINREKTSVRSIAYANSRLYFIEKQATSSEKSNTILDTCRLDNSKCMGMCCDLLSIQSDSKIEQVKIYKTEKPKVKNPCEQKNGGCEQFCFLNSSQGRTCKCGNEYDEKEDGQWCEYIPPDESSES